MKDDGDNLLESLHSCIMEKLAGGTDREEAERVAAETVAAVAYEFGGQQVYFPLKSKYIRRLVRKSFTGNNVPELVQRFRLARSTIYDILKESDGGKKKKSRAVPRSGERSAADGEGVF